MALLNEILEHIMAQINALGDNIVDSFTEDPTKPPCVNCTNSDLMSSRLGCRRLNVVAGRLYTSKVGSVRLPMYTSDGEEGWTQVLDKFSQHPWARHITHLQIEVHCGGNGNSGEWYSKHRSLFSRMVDYKEIAARSAPWPHRFGASHNTAQSQGRFYWRSL